MTRRHALPVAVLLLVLSAAGPLWAQPATQAEAPAKPSRTWELAAGVLVVVPTSLGSANANLLDPQGGTLPLFRTSTDAGMGLGFEANVGTAVAKHVDVELSGAWTRFDVRTTVSDDFEDIPGITVSDRLTRFSVEGAVLWRFVEKTRVSWFVRGGAGWMRELSSDASLVEDGLVLNAGVGMKYWLSANPAGQGTFGLRAEFRVLNRRRGIEIDDGSFRLWPVVAGSAVVRF
jgi:hypothetical protein